MILGTGIDLVYVPRVRRLADRWGPAGLRRIFSEEELEYSFSRRDPALRLAGRFAAKEALVKALGGLPEGARLREAWVTCPPGAPPRLMLVGAWQEELDRRGVTRVHLSLSHGGDYAVGQVLLEGS